MIIFAYEWMTRFRTKQLENKPKGVGRGLCQVDFEAQNDGVRQDGQGDRLRLY